MARAAGRSSNKNGSRSRDAAPYPYEPCARSACRATALHRNGLARESDLGEPPRFRQRGLEAPEHPLAASRDSQPWVMRDAAPALEGPALHLAPVALHLVGIHVRILSLLIRLLVESHP